MGWGLVLSKNFLINKADLEKQSKSCPKTGKKSLKRDIEEVYQFGAGFASLKQIYFVDVLFTHSDFHKGPPCDTPSDHYPPKNRLFPFRQRTPREYRIYIYDDAYINLLW